VSTSQVREISIVRRSWVARTSAVSLAAIALAGAAVTAMPSPAVAKTTANNITVNAEGPLASIATSPFSLTPAFDPKITDYVLRCSSRINSVQVALTARPGSRINVRGNNRAAIILQQVLVENQALIIESHGPKNPGGTEYWIRCLPHDFPLLGVARPGSPPPGWYLTGNLFANTGNSPYVMVLDNYGTPVWYQRSSSTNVANVTALRTGTLAWADNVNGGIGTDPDAAFRVFDFSTQSTTTLKAPIGPLDFHELLPLANGHLILLATPLISGTDMTGSGHGTDATIVDCVIQEVDSGGRLLWVWRASDHVSGNESTHPGAGRRINGQFAYDAFHCNSVDVDWTSSTALVSMRHTDAVYLINRATGRVVWKMGGNSVTKDGEQHLAIVSDPQGAFHAQHDARFQPNGDVSLYDNQSWDPTLTARGVEYHIDPTTGTARLVWAYQASDGRNSGATGSFRRLNGGNDNIIAWGFKGNVLFTEIDAAGSMLMSVTMSGVPYRVLKVDPTILDHRLLRRTAGLTPAS
jgi:Arylsulfotransferase (ASST)